MKDGLKNWRVRLRQVAVPVSELALDAVLEDIGNAELVLLGEATHGSAEFYRYRAQLSRLLIDECGFDAIVVEADWPDALCLDRYVRLRDDLPPGTGDLAAAMEAFRRFPRWMWRNRETAELLRWMRARNAALDPSRRAGFYGLDLYSLHRSMQAVLAYLARADPEAARRARERYACFDHVAVDPQRYGYTAHLGLSRTCEDEVVAQLLELLEQDGSQIASDDDAFFAEQNARVVQNAEAYYRAMFEGRNASWNLRDTHMCDTVEALHTDYRRRYGRAGRLIVWAHNSHIGDARHTEMGEHGQITLGQLVRERFASSYLLGFTTHAGTVCAASGWDAPMEKKTIRPSLPDSIERLLHETGGTRLFVPLRGLRAWPLRRLQRAIGVIYLPHSERLSHYFEAEVAQQFDGLIHIDETRALDALDTGADPGERTPEAETYPSGL